MRAHAERLDTTTVSTRDVVALERAAALGWAADEVVEHTSGWLLRAADGFTGRANSALVLTDPGDALGDVLDEVDDWYRGRGLPARVSVPLPAFSDVLDRLHAAAWTHQWGALVMTRPLAGIVAADGAPAVQIADRPHAAWTARFDFRGEPPDAGIRILTRGDLVAFASIRVGREVVAIARGSVTDGWLGVTAVHTLPNHRRRGHASTLLAALATWARDHGADQVYLQVSPDNRPALTLYRRAGFAEHHRYHYLAPGGDPRSGSC